jgi:ElaB/YqjD/DUF883 family membrane-anchored ribosome-binding protein
MAERDMQKDLEAVKEDLSKLRSDIADLTQKLLDMGKSEAGSARNRIETEARNLVRELRQTLNETGEHGRENSRVPGVIIGTSPTAHEALVSGIIALLKRSRP